MTAPLEIRAPIWKDRSVGIADYKLAHYPGTLRVKITYKDRKGQELFPNVLTMKTAEVAKYPAKKFGSSPLLRIVPISDFEVENE